MTLQELQKEASTCTKCRLAAGRTQVVFGVGNPNADVMFIGEGPGGTFYQTFDVTLDDMGATVNPVSDAIGDVLTYFAIPSKISFKWAFPNFSDFDYTLAPWGDIKSTATAVARWLISRGFPGTSPSRRPFGNCTGGLASCAEAGTEQKSIIAEITKENLRA